MKKNRKTVLIIMIAAGLPILFGINKLLIYIIPAKFLTSDGKITDDGMLWVLSWSASLSFLAAILIFAIIYRFWLAKKNKE